MVELLDELNVFYVINMYIYDYNVKFIRNPVN